MEVGGTSGGQPLTALLRPLLLPLPALPPGPPHACVMLRSKGSSSA